MEHGPDYPKISYQFCKCHGWPRKQARMIQRGVQGAIPPKRNCCWVGGKFSDYMLILCQKNCIWRIKFFQYHWLPLHRKVEVLEPPLEASGGSKPLLQIPLRPPVWRHNFTNRIVSVWNSLPNNVVTANMINTFKIDLIDFGNIKRCFIIIVPT